METNFGKENNKSVQKRFLFFGQHSNIHGVRYILNSSANACSRLFWVLVLIGSAGCLHALLLTMTERVTLVNFVPDTLFLRWSTVFPAVTVCEHFTVSHRKTTEKKMFALYPDLINSVDYSKRVYFAKILMGIATCSRSICVDCGEDVSCSIPWRELSDSVRLTCDELITDCSLNGKPFSCCKMFHLVDSPNGACFAFNSRQIRGKYGERLFSVNRTIGPAELSFRLLYDSKVFVHSPEDLATDLMPTEYQFEVNRNQDKLVEFLFSIIEMNNDPVLQRETIEVRGCRYLHEIPDYPFHTYPVYSYGACELAWNTASMYKQCNCVYPFRDMSYQNMYCNYTGINCIVWQGKQTQDDKYDSGHCLPSCHESELTRIHVYRESRNRNDREGVHVAVKMAYLPTLRYMRKVIRTDLDFVVSVGGMAGLFFGASILSLAETFYLIMRKS